MSLLKVLLYGLGYRAVCIGGAVILAGGLALVRDGFNDVAFTYFIFDLIFSAIMVAIAIPAGLRVVVSHLFLSACWLALLWTLLLGR